MRNNEMLIPLESIEKTIFMIRGQKVILSTDLAALYDVEPRALIQAVKRNPRRFPADFVFQLTNQEAGILKSQSVISSWGGAPRPRLEPLSPKAYHFLMLTRLAALALLLTFLTACPEGTEFFFFSNGQA